MQPFKQRNAAVVRRLLLGAVLMFGFGFALVPLYDVFCRITGLNGKITNIGQPDEKMVVDIKRQVTLQMIAINNESMPWTFKPQQREITVNPGQQKQAAYIVKNNTEQYMVAQAVPSVSPAEAAEYLHKINCFCFDRQPLESLEKKEMPLVFVISPDLPKHINTITLSYTLFDITNKDTTALRNEKQGGARYES